jgi:hypothetical protein
LYQQDQIIRRANSIACQRTFEVEPDSRMLSRKKPNCLEATEFMPLPVLLLAPPYEGVVEEVAWV